MSEFTPLNPRLYHSLRSTYGKVKVDKPGQKLIRRIYDKFGHSEVDIISKGETYRVCCPYCGDNKHKLYVNYTFGMYDPELSWFQYKINVCFRCGPKTDELMPLVQWRSLKNKGFSNAATISSDDEDAGDREIYMSPGDCIPLTDPGASDGADYLRGRGIDPEFASRVYGVSLCVRGNPDIVDGGMTGRLIIPVMYNGEHVGWQSRLARDPPVFSKDQGFHNLRWFTMPGSWRSRHLVGWEQAKHMDWCVIVEGPTDMIKQGPPCIGSLGQSFSRSQARLVAETWGNRRRVIIVGDSQRDGGSERKMQTRTAKLISMEAQCPVNVVELPHGDPGDWDRTEFFQFLLKEVKRNPKGVEIEQDLRSIFLRS